MAALRAIKILGHPGRPGRWPVLCWLVVLGWLLPWGLDQAAAEEIRPPFGFSWGETSARVEQMLTQAKARVVKKEELPNGVRFEVEGIAQRLLRKAFFTFVNDSLEEIELHYGEASWDITQYQNFFDQTRRHIDQRYGPGRLIARTSNSQEGLSHSLIGYQWTQPLTTLQLFLFSAEKAGQSVKILSLHYRGG